MHRRLKVCKAKPRSQSLLDTPPFTLSAAATGLGSEVTLTKVFPSSVVLLTALLAVPTAALPDHQAAERALCRPDPRVLRIESFFRNYDSPAADLASDFVFAADLYNLDWRLLPSISMVESSGGKHFTNNNIFGWDSCRTGFPTVRDGIYTVASRLANSKLYKGKELDEILRVYNPYPDYDDLVMRSITPLGTP